jgi:NAD(P)-dependent dehydrogenase (short-subunit alcohol dehydrogenase family)
MLIASAASANISRTALQGRVAVVTGSGQGIGKEAARVLAYLGARVAIAELQESGLQTQRQIESEGGTALFVQTDVADPESVEHLRGTVQQTLGNVDVLVNNAAAFTTKPVLDHTVEEWDRIFSVNLRGAFLGIKAFLPAMLERRRGVIVTMESAEGMPYLAPYLASKVGLRSLAQSLAQEVGEQSGVSVYCFGPGVVATPGALESFGELAHRYGLGEQEFIEQTGMPLVSAELCATGLVGTVLFAQEFHGQETGYAAGLAKLGLSGGAELRDAQPPAAGTAAAPVSTELLKQAVDLNWQVEAILQTMLKEFDEQSLFVRPIVKRMFQQGTGLTAAEWLGQLGEIRAYLEHVESGTATLDANRTSTYITELQRLADYLKKQQGDARGWIKDPEQLQAALTALRVREVTVRNEGGVLAALRSSVMRPS